MEGLSFDRGGEGLLPTAERRNRATGSGEGSRRCCRSQILPFYMRRSPKVTEVLPTLYLPHQRFRVRGQLNVLVASDPEIE